MLFESGPTPLATKCFGGFDGGSKANVGHYKMHLRNHFVVEKRVAVKNHDSLRNGFWKFHSKSLVLSGAQVIAFAEHK